MSGSPEQSALAALVAQTEGAQLVSGEPTTPVRGVTHDTRRLQPGDLFVAIPGLQHDGARFIAQAIASGAAAVAAEVEPPSPLPVPFVRVARARAALADLAAAFYGQPSRFCPVVGVTGTDGKTSTTWLLSAILEASGLRTGWLTTVNTKVGDTLRPNAVDHTTPEAPVVQRSLAEMRRAGLDVIILETSSHALELDRVRGIQFAVGVFTNLSPEHINFHGSFEAYRAAKRRLFERLPRNGLAVLNGDDPSSQTMGQAALAAGARVLTYGLDRPADLAATDIRLSSSGTSFTLQPSGLPIATRLVGRFNVANWLAAYGAATHFGARPEHLRAAAANQPPVAGRMNLVTHGQPFAVVVDFAHTPQALGKALDTVRSLVSGRVLLAFGLAGGRDVANRPVMGALAAEKADLFAITTDDPGAEDPVTIAEQIAAGARASGAVEIAPDDDWAAAGSQATFCIELDRRAAIRLLFSRARPGDAVLLAGKGHEQRMVVGDERRPWNDARVAAEVLAELGFASHAVP